MEVFLDQIGKLPEYVIAIQGILVAIIGLTALVPGDQPEKALQKAVDFIKKFSKK